MSLYDLYKQSKSKSGSGGQTTTSAYEMYKKKKTEDAFSTTDFSSPKSLEYWANAASKLTSELEDYYKNGSNKYNADFGSAFEGRFESAFQSGKAALAYLEKNKDSISNYDEISKGIQTYLDTFTTAKKSFSETRDYYSQWESEDNYNAYQQREEMLTTDLGGVKTQIADLKNTKDNIESLNRELTAIKSKYQVEANSMNLDPEAAEKYVNDRVNSDKEAKELQDKIDSYGGIVGVGDKLSERTQYYNVAKRLQESQKLTDDALNDEAFEEYALKGANVENISWGEYTNNTYDIFGWEIYSPEIENIVEFYSDSKVTEAVKGLEAHKARTGSGWSPYEKWQQVNAMEENEKKIYNYYIGKGDKASADAYFNNLADTLNARIGADTYEMFENKTALELAFSVAAGVDQFKSGLESLVSDEDYIATSPTQYASGMIREDLADADKRNIFGNSLSQTVYDFGTTAANMMPSILTSTIVGAINPVAGTITGSALMGASASGNAYAEMLNLGYDKGQARSYSALVGASEAGLQLVLGGISKLGGAMSGNAISNAVKGIDNAFARAAIKYGGNMLSEGLEESLQEILDPFFKNLAFNETSNKVKWSDVAYSGLLGALSAGLLEGPSAIADTARSVKTAKAIKSAGQVDKLKAIGNTFAADTVAYKIAQKVDENTGAYTLATLIEEVNGTLTEQNQTDIKNALMENYIAPEHAETISKWLAKAVDGATLTKTQQKALEENEVISKVFGDVIINRNSTVNQRRAGLMEMGLMNGGYVGVDTEALAQSQTPENITKNIAYRIAQERAIEQAVKNGMKKPSDELLSQIEGIKEAQSSVIPERNFKDVGQLDTARMNEALKGAKVANVDGKVADNGTTFRKSTGEEVSIKKIASIDANKNGRTMMLELEDGTKVDSRDISYGDRNQALLYESVLTMGYDAHTANAIIQGYDANGTVSVSDYLIGTNEAFNYGWGHIPEKARGGIAYKALTESQREHAVKIGEDARAADDKARQAKASQNQHQVVKKKTKGGYGAKLTVDSKTVSPRVNESVKALDEVSKALKLNMTILDMGGNSYGFYKASTNEMYIDINAGGNGSHTLLFTASHELVHYIRNWSPEKFTILADFLMEQYAAKGENIDALIRAEIDKAYKATRGEVKMTYDEAYEEVVAQAMQRFLTDSNFIEHLATLQKKDANLAKRIVAKLKEILEKIREAYRGMDTSDRASQAVKEMDEAINELYAKMEEGLISASEASQWIGARNIEDFSEAKNTNGDSLFQYKAMEEDEEAYRQMLKKHGMSEKEINKLFSTIDKALVIIKDNLEILDYAWEADINDRAFSPVKPNSDSLYQVSLDFSTLCRKRILQQVIQTQLQDALNKPISREESIAIRDELMKIQEEGRQIEIACALCYVESARMKSPAQIKKFLRDREGVIKEFLASKSGGSIKQKIKQAELDARERLGVGDATLKSMPEKIAEQIRDAKRQAKKSYTPTAEEQKLIDVASSMTVTDFTSPEGLENLAKNYPVLFDAYTSYVRNATKSKGIEKDTWWRAGDSSSIGDTLIANMNRENGLRSQSWSDFQVIHLLDYIAATIELSTRNAKEQAYSKVPDYIELMGNTGTMLNMSLIPTAQFNGKLEYDGVEGMVYKKALELRDKYHATAGTICIGINNEQIKMLLADDTIDYVIPYHKSGMAAHIRKLMHIPNWDNYESYQSEKNLSREEAVKQAEKYGATLLSENDPSYHKHTSFSEWFNLEEARQIAQQENAFPSDTKLQKKYGVMYGGYMAMKNAADNYLKLCAERGIAPKFSHENANFSAEDNYWKLLIDRKMIDNVTGEIIEQQAIKPIFDEGEVLRILNDELERYPSIKADQDYATRTVVEKFLSGKMNDRLDADTIAAIMQKPVDNIATTNILASEEGVKNQYKDTAISEDMTDSERTEILKDKVIVGPAYEGQVDDIIKKDLESDRITLIKAALQRIGEEFGVFTDYTVKDIDVKVTFSKGNLKESGDKDASPTQLAKLLPLLKDSVENAIGIERHSNRYFYDRATVFFENLFGIYEDGDYIVPIRFGVKHIRNGEAVLYVVVSQEKIKKTEVVKSQAPSMMKRELSRSVFSCTLAQISPFVNSKDLLRYIPDDMLTEDQRNLKWEAVAETIQKTNDKNDKKYKGYIEEGNLNAAKDMVKAAAIANGYTERLFHGTQKFGFTKADTSKSDDKLSFFATNEMDTASSYSALEETREINGESSWDAIDSAIEKLEDSAREGAGDLASAICRWAGYYNAIDSDYIYDGFKNIIDNHDEEIADSFMYEFVVDVLAQQYDEDLNDGMEFYEWEETDEAESLFTLANETIAKFFALSDFESNAENIGNYDLYANTDNLFVVQGNGDKWNNLTDSILPDITSEEYKKYGYRGHWDKWTTRSVARYASDLGYDGVVFKGIIDDGGKGITKVTKPADVYAFFKPQEQVKSADIITYDDNDNIIPISERFNRANDDLRYQFKDMGDEITNGIYISDKEFGKNGKFTYEKAIKAGLKKGETRYEKNSLLEKAYANRERIAIVRSGIAGQSAAYATTKIGKPEWIPADKWESRRNDTRVPKGSEYDLREGQEGKWYYPFVDLHVLPTEIKQEKNSVYGAKFQYKDENSLDSRNLLANALITTAKVGEERNLLRNYQSKINLINAEEQKLTEIRKKLFTKNAVDSEERKKLQHEAKAIATRINKYDKELLKLESMAPMKKVLQKEKDLATKRQKQKDAEAMREYKETVAKTQREIMDRYQKSREKAVEGRNRTATKHKIHKVVSELNTLLLKGTKDKHIPIGLQKPVADALAIINMDSVGAEERVAKYNALIAQSNNPDVIASLTETRDRIQKMGENMSAKLADLQNAYRDIANSDDPLIKNSYDEAIETLIYNTVKTVGNTSLRNMNLEQLEAVYDMYKAILSTVRKANKMFKAEKLETVQQNSESVKLEVREVGGKTARIAEHMKAIKQFGWNELKPIYAMDVIGSKTFTELYNNVRKGEDTWARDIEDAKKFFQDQAEKYGYWKWDLEKKYTFKDSAGNNFTLSLQQIMSIYAYSKRKQADRHLSEGGFVFGESIRVKEKNKLGIPISYEVNDATPYRLRAEDIDEMVKVLEDIKGAKAFVDEMQIYLSDVMGAKGNEVSLAMYDIKLYNEKYYFPLKSSKYFREFDPEKNGTPKIKNSSFSKKTVEYAQNPIVLDDFMSVWTNHVNDMSMYHSFVLPLEDFTRVYNYCSTAGGYDSVQQYIKDAYGSQAGQYIESLLADLNGGIVSDKVKSPFAGLVGKFKKTAVAMNTSVIVQQPTAIVRAMAMVDPKYFIKRDKSLKFNEKWEQLKKYAPVAVIKEMGGFDSGGGRQADQYIMERKSLKDENYRDNLMMKGAELADQFGWNRIWDACKQEVQATTNLKGEELLKKAGERFTEVIVRTQVYDSTLSRSGFMRSQSDTVKMATAFMGEPTTSVNMIYGAILQSKRGNISKGRATRTIAFTVLSILLSSALKSAVGMARDDDEDESLREKYFQALGGNLLSDLNPLNTLPFVKDIVSIFEGWEVERTDMALVSDLKDAIDGLSSDSKPWYRKVEDLSVIASFAGIPLKNIIREIRGLISFGSDIFDDVESDNGWEGFVEGVTGKETTIISSLDSNNTERAKELINDKIAGYIADGKTEKEAKSYVRSSLTSEYKERYLEAYAKKDNDELIRIRKLLHSTGVYDNVVETCQNWVKDSKK